MRNKHMQIKSANMQIFILKCIIKQYFDTFICNVDYFSAFNVIKFKINNS